MVRIELLEVTENLVRYRYFPEESEDYGIVALNKKDVERVFEKLLAGYGTMYAAHALKRIEEYCKNGDYLQKDIVIWY